MPKAKEMKYRDRTATAERPEYDDEKTEDKTQYAAERVEFADEKTEDKTQYPAENRDNSYLAANQHMVKFADELRGINEQAALGFDRRKNPAEYELKEKQEMLEAVTEAFNATNWNSAIERRLAADDIAQNLYQPMYPRVEIAEAAVQHKLPGEFMQELKQEKIEYFERKHDDTGAEALNFTVRDMETAERMVEQSNGMFHVVSTRNLDHSWKRTVVPVTTAPPWSPRGSWCVSDGSFMPHAELATSWRMNTSGCRSCRRSAPAPDAGGYITGPRPEMVDLGMNPSP